MISALHKDISLTILTCAKRILNLYKFFLQHGYWRFSQVHIEHFKSFDLQVILIKTCHYMHLCSSCVEWLTWHMGPFQAISTVPMDSSSSGNNTTSSTFLLKLGKSPVLIQGLCIGGKGPLLRILRSTGSRACNTRSWSTVPVMTRHKLSGR